MATLGLGEELFVDDSLNRALGFLPHGREFRFIDRLLQLEPGRSGSAEYEIREDAAFLRGHFPGQPIFPGVLLIEAAAQLAGVVAQSDAQIGALPGLKLTAVRGVKILGTAKPGEVIRLEARITGRLGKLIQAEVSVFLREEELLRGSLALSGEVEG